MDAPPCAAHRMTKNVVFQWIVESVIQTAETTQRHLADAVVRQAVA